MPERLPVTLCEASLPRSAHVCAFFESEEEHYASVIPYFAEGLLHDEQLLNIYAREDHAAHVERLESAGVPARAAIARKQLNLTTPEETYLEGGSFDIGAMFNRVEATLLEARTSEFPFVRTCGDMGWALDALASTDALIEYEARLNFLTTQHSCTFVCAYDSRKFSPETLRDILSTHPQVLIGLTVLENPQYVPPMKYLKKLISRKSASLRRSS